MDSAHLGEGLLETGLEIGMTNREQLTKYYQQYKDMSLKEQALAVMYWRSKPGYEKGHTHRCVEGHLVGHAALPGLGPGTSGWRAEDGTDTSQRHGTNAPELLGQLGGRGGVSSTAWA